MCYLSPPQHFWHSSGAFTWSALFGRHHGSRALSQLWPIFDCQKENSSGRLVYMALSHVWCEDACQATSASSAFHVSAQKKKKPTRQICRKIKIGFSSISHDIASQETWNMDAQILKQHAKNCSNCHCYGQKHRIFSPRKGASAQVPTSHYLPGWKMLWMYMCFVC